MTPPPPLPPPATTGTQPNPQLQPPPPIGQSVAPPGAFPGSLTPGWNDPPPVNADATSSNRRPRLDLRKRVAHPMNPSEGVNHSRLCSDPDTDTAPRRRRNKLT